MKSIVYDTQIANPFKATTATAGRNLQKSQSVVTSERLWPWPCVTFTIDLQSQMSLTAATVPDLTFSEMQFLSRPFDADHSPQVANPRNARRANSQPEAKEGNPTTFKNDAAQHGEFNGSLGVEGSRHPLTKSSVTPQPVQRSATAGSPRNPLPERDMKACNHSLARSSLRGQFDMDAAIKKCLWRPTTAILAGQLHSPLQTFAERRSADVSSPMQGTPPSMPRRPPSDPGRPTSTGDKRRKPPMPETKETSADEAGAASCYPHESHDGMHTQQCRTIDGPSSPLNRLLRACDTATTALPQQHEDLSLDRTALGMSELLDYSEPIHRLGHNGWRGASYAQFNDSGPIAFTGKHDSFPVMLPTRPQRARLVHGGDALYCQRDGFNFPDSGIGSQQGFPPLILRHDTRGEGRMVYETRIDVSQSRGDIGHDDSVENDQGETLEQPQDWAECLNDARGLCGYASVELDGAPKRDWQFDPCLEADGRVDYQQAADTAAADHPAPEDTEPHGIVPQGFWQRNVLC